MCPSADGSPWREINTDGTDRLMSYQGCGCAGGEVMTMQSELVPRDDQPLVNARRTQKVYADVLGRSFKTQITKCRRLRSEVQRGNIRGLRELQYCKSDPGCF